MSQVLAQQPDQFSHSLDTVSVGPSHLTDDIFSLLKTQDHANIRIFTKVWTKQKMNNNKRIKPVFLGRRAVLP